MHGQRGPASLPDGRHALRTMKDTAQGAARCRLLFLFLWRIGFYGGSVVLVALLPGLYMLLVRAAAALLAGLYVLLVRRMVATAGFAALAGDFALLALVHRRKTTLAVVAGHVEFSGWEKTS
jgi:hypothetical protein